MKKQYVSSPITTKFIEEGKKYLVKENRGAGFSIDKGVLEIEAQSDLECLFKKCTHLKGKDWKLYV